MFKNYVVLSGSTGLNTKDDPVRLRTEDRSAVRELAIAVNVDIEDTGRISRVKGYTAHIRSACHSIFGVKDHALGVIDGYISAIEKDGTVTPIVEVNNDATVRYLRVGGKTYWCNGLDKGVIEDRVNSAWVGNDYVGPTSYKDRKDPPAGHLLEIHSGRIYIADRNVLWYTEPYAYSWVNRAADFIWFDDRITLVTAVTDGIWVGTERELFLLKGMNPKTDMVQRKISDYGAVEGAVAKIPGYRFGKEGVGSQVSVWVSHQGICAGLEGGVFVNLTGNKVGLPTAAKGAGIYMNDRVIFTLDP